MNTPPLIEIREAARRLGVSKMTIRRYIASGRLPAKRIGPKLIRVDPRDLEKLMDAETVS